ncbi:MAG: sigma-54-dependent Fis family transcriptional regulator [Oleispira sp.]|nr:sigma-54-dependent Fis family transcriptional regulator [Oleispira sp.]
MTYKALIIDDEPDIRDLIQITLERMDIDCACAATFSEAITLLEQQEFHFCLTDMKLPDGNGMDLIALAQKKYTKMPIAMITAFGNMETAIAALKSGAFDFIAKPIDLTRLRNVVTAALKLTEVPLASHVCKSNSVRLIGQSAAMAKLNNHIEKVARTQAPIFIHGPSGTGKELVSQLIHSLGVRRDQPFIAVNCGAIPRDLMESEFFGHMKGSFTGAHSNKLGFFRAAEGGTLFLDEVAELPLEMQAKLLRVIQEQAVRPVGHEHEQSINVRILSASHRNLHQRVEDGLFRQDLYYRLNVITVEVPPLAQRPDDIPLLADHFLQKYAQEWQMPALKLAPETLTALCEYSFPGNVRELENILQRAFTMTESEEISIEDLNLPNHQSPIIETTESTNMANGNLEAYIENIERLAINEALEATRWNKTAAAEKLGISFRALRYRCTKLNIE